MTRSGLWLAARRAIAANGQTSGSLQSWTARPSSRQPVSPMTTILRTSPGRIGAGEPPTISWPVTAGARASQTATGKPSSAPARDAVRRSIPSAVASGQAVPAATAIRTERVPSDAISVHGPGQSAAQALVDRAIAAITPRARRLAFRTAAPCRFCRRQKKQAARGSPPARRGLKFSGFCRLRFGGGSFLGSFLFLLGLLGFPARPLLFLVRHDALPSR